jgi:biopolymer transport protein ExbD
MRFRRGRPTGFAVPPKLTLVALIDVCLFLLLYFMIASSFSGPEAELASGIKTEKPGAGRAQDLAPLVMDVKLEGGRPTFRLGERVSTERDALRDLLKQMPKEGGVVVRVAGDVPVQAAATALQACKDAGFVRVSYVPSN